MIESGSCCTLLAEQIVQKEKMTIITNSVYIANYIRPATSNTCCLAGRLSAPWSQW